MTATSCLGMSDEKCVVSLTDGCSFDDGFTAKILLHLRHHTLIESNLGERMSQRPPTSTLFEALFEAGVSVSVLMRA